MHIIQLTPAEARNLLAELQAADSKSNLRSLRVCVEGDHAKFKVNEWIWSPPLGQLDPSCETAIRRRREQEATK